MSSQHKRQITRSTAAAAPNHGDLSDLARPPPLPATVFGAAMDYLRYSEVRTTLLVGKVIAQQAVKHVQTLNVCKPFELNVKASKRFCNVREVNILCLVYGLGENANRSLNRDAALRAVPFLSSFPKLDTAFLGGARKVISSNTLEYQWKACYSAALCRGPDNHVELFTSLLMSFCGAFDSRALPQSLDLRGVQSGDRVLCGRDRGPDCPLCSQACRSFPFRWVLDMKVFGDDNAAHCKSDRDRLEIIKSRPGGRQCLEKESKALEMYLIRYAAERVPTRSSVAPTIAENRFTRRLVELGAIETLVVHYAPLETLQLCLRYGFNPRNVTRKRVASILKRRKVEFYAFSDDSKKEVLAKASFDRLVAAGFALEEHDFIVIDAANEPILANMESLLR